MAYCNSNTHSPMDDIILERLQEQWDKDILFGSGLDECVGIMNVQYQVGRKLSSEEIKEMDDVMSYYKIINRLNKKMEGRNVCTNSR